MMEQIGWGMMLVSVAAVILNIHKLKMCFVLWIITNSWWLIYDLYKGAYSQACLFGVYLGLAIYGLIKWRKDV